MKKNKGGYFRQFLILLFCFSALLVSSFAQARDASIGAAINVRQVISLSKTADMNFGILEYDAAHAGKIVLATNGDISVSGGSIGLLINGTANAARLTFSGDSKSTVEISCSDAGLLSNGSGQTLPLSNVEFAMNAGVASGAGVPCSGLGVSPHIVSLESVGNPSVYMGAVIDVASNAVTGDSGFSTANSGGASIIFRVVYQ